MQGNRREQLIFAASATAAATFYLFFTHHVWEDYFITFRHSQNLVEGRGLLYNPGEKVHGFTSPLGVLLPAFFYWITGASSYVLSLALFRVVSIAAYVGAGLVIYRLFIRLDGEARLPRFAFAALYVLEVKSVMFSVNGMESGFMLFFLACCIFVSQDHRTHWVAAGIAWAGLLWTRPDAIVYIAALVLAALVFSRTPRWRLLGPLLGSALIALLLYGPWLLWAKSYYGDPLPHTVLAKSIAEDPSSNHIQRVLIRLWRAWPKAAAEMFQPIYFWDGEGWLDGQWCRWIILIWSWTLGIFCMTYWLLPSADRLARAASLAFFIVTLYFAFLYFIFPWYMPPATLLALIVLARGLLTLRQLASPLFPPADACRLHRLALGLVALLILGQATLFSLTAWEIRVQQREIEEGNRRRVGEWLRARLQPHDRVFLEPTGYIGYFSGAHVLDYPGLVSPEVVRRRRETHANQASLVATLKAEWVILRPKELEAVEKSDSAAFLKDAYEVAAEFDVRPVLEQYSFLPGRRYLLYDACFYVYHKRPLKSPAIKAAKN
jgi:hypothetical protein